MILQHSSRCWILLFLCLSSIYAVEDTEEEPYDFWRQEGFDPADLECGTTPMSTTRLSIGDIVVLDTSVICDYSGILLEDTEEAPGSNVGWLQQGHWVGFDVALSTSGIYDMKIRTSSVTGDGAFDLLNADTGEVYKHFEGVANTGSWQIWETMSAGKIALPRGSTTLKVESLGSGWNLLWIELNLTHAFEDLSSDYDYLIQAQNFTSRYDRSEKEHISLTNSSEPGLLNINNIYDGDELDFQLRVRESGKYTLYARISNPLGVGSFVVYNTRTAQMYGIAKYPMPATDSWSDWTTILVSDIFLMGDRDYPMGVFVVEGGWNLEWLALDLELEMEVTKQIEPHRRLLPARDFDSIQGAVVDDVNHNIGSIQNGAVLEYTLSDIPITGNTILRIWVASPNGMGSFKVYNRDSEVLLGEFSPVPASCGWLCWIALEIRDIAGTEHTPIPLRIEISEGGFNLFALTYVAEEFYSEMEGDAYY